MPVPLVQVVRSGVVESVHLGDVAVCDASGRAARVGGRSRPRHVRPVVHEADPGGRLDRGDRRAAVRCRRSRSMCSSPQRRAGARARGAAAAATRRASGSMRCGTRPARPIDDEAAARVARAGADLPGLQRQPCGDARRERPRRAGRSTSYRSRRHPHHRRVLPLVGALAGAEPGGRRRRMRRSRSTGCRCGRSRRCTRGWRPDRHRVRRGARSRDGRDARGAVPRRRPRARRHRRDGGRAGPGDEGGRRGARLRGLARRRHRRRRESARRRATARRVRR